MGLFLVFLLFGLIFGVVGVSIATNKNVDGLIGFLLGAFLGPLGLIIIALLNPTSVASTESTSIIVGDSPPCERDLTLDAYQLWLAAKYNVTKNELFGRFVLRDQTFADLEGALAAAHAFEEAHLDKLAEQEDERRLRTDKLVAQQKEQAAKDAAIFRKIIVPALAALACGGMGLAYISYKASKKLGDTQREHQNSIEKMKNQFNSEISQYGIEYPPRDISTNSPRVIYSSKINGKTFIEPQDSIFIERDFHNPTYSNSPSRKDFDNYGREIQMCSYNEFSNKYGSYNKVKAGGRFISFFVWDSTNPYEEIKNQLESNGYEISWVGQDGISRDIGNDRTFLKTESGKYANIYINDPDILTNDRKRFMRVDLCFGNLAKNSSYKTPNPK